MKKLILMLFVLVGTIQFTTAQSGSGYGIKGGLNYGSNGKLISNTGDIIAHPDRNLGFNLGVFAKFGSWIYIKPELLYTNTSSEYSSGNSGDSKFKIQQIDLPVNVGLRLIGPLSIFAGPSFQYNLSSKLDGKKAEDVYNEITTGYNVGLAFSLRRFAIDLRYEGAFSANQNNFLNNNGVMLVVDSRPEQLILNLSIRI
ncbi:outer membrane beta-barrel protein [Formosa sp. 3Alg 14/1]|uniref:outer membrane beta-barrel protein n=1 Tax=Formosa sp. 3Alg 14/1 TaxID=3382190 RepID=UPI0039BDB751